MHYFSPLNTFMRKGKDPSRIGRPKSMRIWIRIPNTWSGLFGTYPDTRIQSQTLQCHGFSSMLRIRDVYPGSEFFSSRIRGQKDPGARIRISKKDFKYF
jgi:hypothetical protein